jgi:hypothetical protein
MVYGAGGKFGVAGNAQSASCRMAEAVGGSNLTLTAIFTFYNIQINPKNGGQWWATALRSDQRYAA